MVLQNLKKNNGAEVSFYKNAGCRAASFWQVHSSVGVSFSMFGVNFFIEHLQTFAPEISSYDSFLTSLNNDADGNLKSIQTSEMEFSMKWSFQLLTVFARGFTLNVWLGSEYAFVMFTSSKKRKNCKVLFNLSNF